MGDRDKEKEKRSVETFASPYDGDLCQNILMDFRAGEYSAALSLNDIFKKIKPKIHRLTFNLTINLFLKMTKP